MSKKILMLPLMCLLLAGLVSACGSDATRFEKAQLAKGFSQGEAVGATTTFSPSDKVIHMVLNMGGDTNGAKVKVAWIAVDTADGAKNKTLAEKEYTAFIDLRDYDVTYSVPEGSTLATGKYKAEVYLNGKLDRTLEFTVQ